jgi:exodeoxyribonuclease VII small subunit
MTKSKDKPLKYEEATAELEGILAAIESGQIGLEESLAKLDRGIVLIKHCRGILDAAETRIAELSVDAKGDLKVSARAEGEAEEGR